MKGEGMRYEATVAFAGQVSMRKGEVRELTKPLAAPLVKCGYLKEVKQKESKRNNTGRSSESHSRDQGKSVGG